MDFNLKDAQRKERMGLTKEAMISVTDAQKDRIAADKAKLEALKAAVRSSTDAGRAFRAPAAGKPGAGPKLAEINYANILANLKATSQPKEGESPEAFNTRLSREASELAVAQSKISDAGPNRTGAQQDALTATQNRKVIDRMAVWETGLEKRKAQAEGPAALAKAREAAEKEFIRQAMQGMSGSDDTAAPTDKPRTVINYDANGKRIN